MVTCHLSENRRKSSNMLFNGGKKNWQLVHWTSEECFLQRQPAAAVLWLIELARMRNVEVS
jgi:hypothetical protein